MQSQSEGEAPPLTGELGGVDGEGGAGHRGEPRPWWECTTALRVISRVKGPGWPEGPPQGAAATSGLPCQNSHNSTEGCAPAAPEFPASARRTAYALQQNVTAMCEEVGLERVGFLTLTHAEHILCPRESQRRYNSFLTHVLRRRYGRVIRVLERQKSGRIHYHLLVALGDDIRSSCDLAAFERRDYRTAPPALRREWAYLRSTAKAYGFGRTELLPVKSTGEAIGRYVGKYIGKHIEQRELRDKGVRLVSYTGAKVACTRFAWVGGNASRWRRQLAAFVQMLYESEAITEPSTSAMAKRFGPRWAYHWRDQIMTFPEESSDVEQGNGEGSCSDSRAGPGLVPPPGRRGLSDAEDDAAADGSHEPGRAERPCTWHGLPDAPSSVGYGERPCSVVTGSRGGGRSMSSTLQSGSEQPCNAKGGCEISACTDASGSH